MKMQAGDVVFFKKQDTFISSMIAKLTSSDFTHVGLALDGEHMIESNRFIDTRVVRFVPDENLHVIYRYPGMDDTMKEKVRINALRFNSMPYDYLQIVQFFFRLVFNWNLSFLNRRNRLICSELIDYTFIASGLERKHKDHVGDIVVGELIDLYNLKEVSTCLEK